MPQHCSLKIERPVCGEEDNKDEQQRQRKRFEHVRTQKKTSSGQFTRWLGGRTSNNLASPTPFRRGGLCRRKGSGAFQPVVGIFKSAL